MAKNETHMQRLSIIGAGAWGTALAIAAHRAGRDVTIWAFEADVAAAINDSGQNSFYLPGFALDRSICATTDIAVAARADALLLTMPAQHLRRVAAGLAPHVKADTPVVICAKGIEVGTGALLSEVVSEVLPMAVPAVLSGPTFAAEVARGLPTAVTLAACDEQLAERLAAAIGTPHLRIYTATDVIGAEIGGAVKNVLAIACGIVGGRKLGDNTRAALITRGLAEILRLGLAKGAKLETLMGLSGIGDLTLTCNAMQSRNYSLGVALGQGKALADILANRRSVAEGVFTASSVVSLARRLGVEMPICTAIDAIINHGADLNEAISRLLSRPLRPEPLDNKGR
jgi:glycerol-3-phosphate dehydrogenase (NAD(P)+)